MLSVKYEPFMLSAVMLNVVMISVVMLSVFAPNRVHVPLRFYLITQIRKIWTGACNKLQIESEKLRKS